MNAIVLCAKCRKQNNKNNQKNNGIYSLRVMFVIICQSLFVCRHRAEMTIATTNESEKKHNANMLILFLIHPEWNSEMVISTFSLSLSYTWNGSDSFFFHVILVTLDSAKYLKQQHIHKILECRIKSNYKSTDLTHFRTFEKLQMNACTMAPCIQS